MNLLTDQVEFANGIVLNKTDLVDKETLGLLESHDPQAEPWRTDSLVRFRARTGRPDFRNTGLFDFEEAQQSAGWQRELEAEQLPETEEYGISSFVFRDKRPFHPENGCGSI